MRNQMLTFAALIALTSPALGQEEKPAAPSPNAIVDAAKAAEWVPIPAEDLLVMTLAPDSDGKARKVVIQLMPAPFSQGWVSNIRTLARAKWYDGITVNRVQDNYVVQWGDADGEDPAKAKPLPKGLKVMDEGDYSQQHNTQATITSLCPDNPEKVCRETIRYGPQIRYRTEKDPYAKQSGHLMGWPIGVESLSAPPLNISFGGRASTPTGISVNMVSPVHCYGMVGVGRGYSPDTGSGAELYTVIGHAPRHLDRNIALVGRIISGMEHLSSMKRGSGDLGFYTEDEAGLRTPIQSIRVVSDMPAKTWPKYEYLSTESETFARYAEARANRRDPFFITPAGGADICNIPVPVRQMPSD